MRRVIVISFLLFILISCGKNPVVPDTQIDSFPMSIGNQWIYEVHNRIVAEPTGKFYPNKPIDTVVLTVLDSLPIRSLSTDDDVLIYSTHQVERRFTEYIDTVFITLHGTHFSMNFDDVWINLNYPLYSNKSWQNGSEYDSTHVYRKSSIETLAGTFRNSFHIQSGRYTGPALNYREQFKDFWLTPNVGIVRFYLRVTDGLLIAEEYSWNLIDYKIK